MNVGQSAGTEVRLPLEIVRNRQGAIHAISSGCFRLANGDIIDLFDRVPLNTKVVVRHGASL